MASGFALGHSARQSRNPATCGLKPFCGRFLDAATARSMTGACSMTGGAQHDGRCAATFSSSRRMLSSGLPLMMYSSAKVLQMFAAARGTIIRGICVPRTATGIRPQTSYPRLHQQLILLQRLPPRRALSRMLGRLARARGPRWLRRRVIRAFIARYRVDLTESEPSCPEAYESFNAFLTLAIFDRSNIGALESSPGQAR